MCEAKSCSKSKLLLGFLAFVTAVSITGLLKTPNIVKTSAESENGASFIFNEEVPDVSVTGLRVVLNQSAITETSQSFKFSFASDVAGAYINPSTGDARNYPEVVGIYIAVDDASYPRDLKMVDLPYYDVEPFPTDGSEKDQLRWREAYQKKDSDGNFLYKSDGSPELLDNHFYASDRPIYNAYVHRIEVANNQTEIVIPRFIQYGTRWVFRVNYIGEDVFNAKEAKTAEDKKAIYKDLKTIVLGDNISSVSEIAILNTPSDLSIKFVSSEEDITFPESLWTDCQNISFNYTPTVHELSIFDGSLKGDDEDPNNPVREKAHIFASASPRSFSSPYTFVMGYLTEDSSKNKPLILEYCFNGENTRRFAEFELNKNAKYGADVVGQDAGAYTLDKNIEFRVDSEHAALGINRDSLVIHNIFEMKTRLDPEHDPIEPNLEKEYSSKVKIGEFQEVTIDELVDANFKGAAEIFGYGRIELSVVTQTDNYKKFKEAMYESYKSKIESGQFEIRFLIRGLRSSYYIFTMNDGNVIKVSLLSCTKTGIPIDYIILNTSRVNNLQFMFINSKVSPGFNLSKVKRVEIQGLTISMDLCATKTGTSQIVGKSDILFRFGYTDLMPYCDRQNVFNGNLFLMIMLLSFAVAFIICATAYYFYHKNKFKNDEFKRMDTKKYLKKCSIGFLGSAFVFTAITFIILRFALFNNSITMHNSLDPFVIGFGIVALIFIGYFIKFIVVTIRQNKERRKRIELALDSDVDSDGTN